jgi:16S rRNA (guanine(966)-N(2))-methyltransferase RsmD
MMRVIAGSLKGRRLATPDWQGLRPTSDKLRETLFNVVAPRIPGARVLDAYAGTGAIGIEAISRGAAHVTFVDRDRRATRLIAENLRRCGIAEGYAIIRDDVGKAFAREPQPSFDLIVLDPPYEVSDAANVLDSLALTLDHRGLIVLEHARRRAAPLVAGRLVHTRDIVSGDSVLTLYEIRHD